MKKIGLITVALIFISAMAYSQKFGFIDSEYILSNIPSYKAAQDQLDRYSEQWQKEIEEKYDEIEKLYKDFQAEKVLLTDEMRKKREEEIINREKEVKELQKQYFGREGELFQKREELIKPVQDEVYNAVKEIAAEGGYAAIYDSSAGPTLIYTDPKYDKSDEVLKKLGYKN